MSSGSRWRSLVQRSSRANTIFRSLFFMPQMVSLVVVALVWQVLLVDKIGLLNSVIASFGFASVSWLGDPSFALGTIVVISLWFLMGFYMLIFLGGLQDIPQEYYDAARIDGAERRGKFLLHHAAAAAAHKLLRAAGLGRHRGVRLSNL